MRGRSSSSGRIFYPKFNKEKSESIEFRKNRFFCSYPRGQTPKECDLDILVIKRRVHSKFK
jgi:predicted nucleotidyltransferase